MTHYSEDDLTLYYYGEGRRRAAIETHLQACAACASLYREIAGTLRMIPAGDVPQRGDQYGLEVWQRLRHKLPERDASPWAGSWTAWVGSLWSDRLALAAAAALLVVAAFVAGRVWPRQAANPTPVGTSAAGNAVDSRRILLASVADHLDRSERVLTDVMNAPDRGDISTEQHWAEDLIEASRLYRQDAADAGEQSVAAVLDDLERSLLEIVHSPSTISAADLELMRRRIDAATLLFKVRVMGDELRRREDAPGAGDTPRTSTRKIS